jgi:hypothetical protein
MNHGFTQGTTSEQVTAASTEQHGATNIKIWQGTLFC